MTQPQALYLADVLEDAGKPADIAETAAAELRRLHADTEYMVELVKKLVAQRDALLEALKLCLPYASTYSRDGHAAEQARAAIAAAEGEDA